MAHLYRLHGIKHSPPAEKSLTALLYTKFPNGMPEKLIAIVLDEILIQLQFDHDTPDIGAHRHIKSTRIGVYLSNQNPADSRIELGHLQAFMHMYYIFASPEAYPGARLEFDCKSVGILALEMAYGSLPDDLQGEQFHAMVQNLVTILSLKLQGAEKERTIKRMPDDLNMMLDNEYVNRREQTLQAKAQADNRQKAKFLWGDAKKYVANGFSHPDGNREFSRDFLEVVRRLLDRNPPAMPINEIRQLPFIQQRKDMAYFCKEVRKTKSKRR